MMTNILVWVEIVVLIGVSVSLPIVLGLVFRLALKRVAARLIAVLAGALIFLLNSRVSPWSEMDTLGTKVTQGRMAGVDLSMHAMLLIIWVLASFGIPCLLAWIGVGISERIIRRKRPNQASEAIAPQGGAQPQR